MPAEPEVAAAVRDAAQVFAGLGARVTEGSPDFAGADEAFRTLRAWQFEVMLGELLDRHPGELKDSLRQNVELGRKLTGPDVGRAEQLHTALFHRVRTFFSAYDLLLLPVSQVLPFGIGLEYPAEVAWVAMTDYLDWMRSAYPVTLTGCPALAVPAGFSAGGLPVGVQIVGPHRAGFAVLQAGHAFEQATQAGRRRPPGL